MRRARCVDRLGASGAPVPTPALVPVTDYKQVRRFVQTGRCCGESPRSRLGESNSCSEAGPLCRSLTDMTHKDALQASRNPRRRPPKSKPPERGRSRVAVVLFQPGIKLPGPRSRWNPVDEGDDAGKPANRGSRGHLRYVRICSRPRRRRLRRSDSACGSTARRAPPDQRARLVPRRLLARIVAMVRPTKENLLVGSQPHSGSRRRRTAGGNWAPMMPSRPDEIHAQYLRLSAQKMTRGRDGDHVDEEGPRHVADDGVGPKRVALLEDAFRHVGSRRKFMADYEDAIRQYASSSRRSTARFSARLSLKIESSAKPANDDGCSQAACRHADASVRRDDGKDTRPGELTAWGPGGQHTRSSAMWTRVLAGGGAGRRQGGPLAADPGVAKPRPVSPAPLDRLLSPRGRSCPSSRAFCVRSAVAPRWISRSPDFPNTPPIGFALTSERVGLHGRPGRVFKAVGQYAIKVKAPRRPPMERRPGVAPGQGQVTLDGKPLADPDRSSPGRLIPPFPIKNEVRPIGSANTA